MLDILNVVLPVFILIGVGYVARWVNLISDALVDHMMRYAVTFAAPALLFRGVSTLDLGAHFEGAMLASFYISASVCFLAGLFGARLLFQRGWEDSIAIGFVCLFSNSLMLGLPITERAYGPEALSGNFAIISVHSLFTYGIGITAMEIVKARGQSAVKTTQTVLKGMLSNALVLAIALGFVVNLSGLTLPSAVTDSIWLLSDTALPCALFAIGGVLRRYRPEGDMRTILFACAVSLILHPVLTFGLGSALGLSTESMRSAVLTAAMAPGINAYLFANLYGHAKRVAASSVLIATAFSILTVSGWLILLP